MLQDDNNQPVECWDSMRSAAAGLKIPIELLKIAKSMGCEAFRGSRVYGIPLRKWLDDNPDALTGDEGESTESLAFLKKQLLKQQIRRAREGADSVAIANSIKRGELVSRQDLEFAIPKCLAHAISIQRQHLPTELFNVVCKETKEGFSRILNEAPEKEEIESTANTSSV